MKALVVSILLTIPLGAAAQDYLEASGQTVTFNLAAGSQAAWNPAASGTVYAIPAKARIAPSIRLLPDRTTFIVEARGSAPASIALYNMAGRRIACAFLAGTLSSFKVASPLAPGYYAAKLEPVGETATITRFLVAR